MASRRNNPVTSTRRDETAESPVVDAKHYASLLWGLCDILRDDGITYHQYINELSYLLFLKMAAETGQEDALCGYTWRELSTAPNPDEQFKRYKKMLVDLGNDAHGVVKEIYANPTSLIRKARTLELLISGIDRIDWHDASGETFGNIYEDLLGYSAEKRSGAGQYFTPRALIESIISVMQPKMSELVEDPALGTAGFLVAAHQYIRATKGAKRGARYVGVELVPDNYRLALMNGYVHEMEVEFHLQDTLSPFGSTLPEADLIVTNPPFGARRGGGGPSRSDLPFPTSNKQLAFLQHIYLGLKAGGRAAVVLPDNVLFEGNTGKQIRADLMGKCNLHTILRLPTGIFYAQGVKTNVLFFTRGEKDKGNTKEVWVYDLRANMPQFGKRTLLIREHFAEFEAAFGQDASGSPKSLALRKEMGEEGRFRKFTRKWIADRGENLDIAWLKDESDAANGELPEPAVLAREAMTELEGAFEELRGVLAELGEDFEEAEA